MLPLIDLLLGSPCSEDRAGSEK